VFASSKYCDFKTEVFSKTMVFFCWSIGERGLYPLFFPKTKKKEKKNYGIC
jgi:hypothetical protein